MTPFRVALATLRRPKIDGAKAAFATAGRLWGLDPAAVEWITADVPSGVDETPIRLEHLLDGARNRAQALRARLEREGRPAQFYVGLEGGLWSVERAVFLQSWAYVTDGRRDAFGASGAVPVPAALAEAVLDRGRSLGEVIDVLAGAQDVRSQEGAWGVLTRGHVTRERSFEAALLNALAPFFNRGVYERRLG